MFSSWAVVPPRSLRLTGKARVRLMRKIAKIEMLNFMPGDSFDEEVSLTVA